MRKQATYIRCDGDGCQRAAEVEGLTDLPEDWYRIAKGTATNKPDRDGFDLCSLKCVGRWARGRAQVLAANGNGHDGTPPERGITMPKNWQCPVCEQFIAGQGKRMHLVSHASEGVIRDDEIEGLMGPVGERTHARRAAASE